MSKIGKKPILVPTGVAITVQDRTVTVKGPKGELSREIPAGLDLRVEGNLLLVRPTDGPDSTTWGLYRALVKNMVVGVSEGFTRALEFQGVGYKAAVKGSDLELSLGYSHPVTVRAPEGITFSVEKNTITIAGIDKELVGHVAATIRSKREPEPYKLSGIKYVGEVIKKKAGKKAVATS